MGKPSVRDIHYKWKYHTTDVGIYFIDGALDVLSILNVSVEFFHPKTLFSIC